MILAYLKKCGLVEEYHLPVLLVCKKNDRMIIDQGYSYDSEDKNLLVRLGTEEFYIIYKMGGWYEKMIFTTEGIPKLNERLIIYGEADYGKSN